MWVFGYGSIVWKSDFPTHDTMFGYVEGYHRRFWQGSPHHRGTPDRAGRVVTLVSSDDMMRYFRDNDAFAHVPGDNVTYGRLYKVPGEHVEATLVQLDARESNYQRRNVRVHCLDGETRDAVMYIAAPGSVAFIGPASMRDMVQQIATSVGASGRNDEYLHRLCATMRSLQVTDAHLFALERAFLDHIDSEPLAASTALSEVVATAVAPTAPVATAPTASFVDHEMPNAQTESLVVNTSP